MIFELYIIKLHKYIMRYLNGGDGGGDGGSDGNFFIINLSWKLGSECCLLGGLGENIHTKS